MLTSAADHVAGMVRMSRFRLDLPADPLLRAAVQPHPAVSLYERHNGGIYNEVTAKALLICCAIEAISVTAFRGTFVRKVPKNA